MKFLTKSIFNALLVGVVLSLSLGQLERVQLTPQIAVYVHDIVLALFVGLWGLYLLITKSKPFSLKHYQYLLIFSLWAGVTLLVHWTEIGFLYYLRWLVFVLLPWAVYDLSLRKVINLDLDWALLGWLLFMLATGVTQYLVLPDTRLLKQLGWDDHFDRLIGVYFDPGFTGLMTSLGVGYLLTCQSKVHKLSVVSRKYLLGVTVITTMLTYSRASMVSLVVVIGAGTFLDKQWKVGAQLLLLAGVTLILLPHQVGEGVDLTRTQSIESRIKSTTSATDIFIENPLLGIGFNNYRQVLPADSSGIANHTSAPDNSYVFVLATTGIIGLLLFGVWLGKISLFGWRYSPLLLVSVLGVSVHAWFNNSWFYPFVLIWFGLIYAKESVSWRR